ncbi:hypothetical protein A9498_31105 (plasmid) [Bacillus thuringiensis serovar coreanensis]|nr:hypothetical protein A9498_31105 [Bacillus thuringiensis serovar coreanensis]
MAIINLLSELEAYGRNYAASHQYRYETSYSDDMDPLRISAINETVPDRIVQDGIKNIVLDRRNIRNTTSSELNGVFSFSNTYTNKNSTQTIDGVTAGTNITIKAFANLMFAEVGLSGNIAFEGNITNSNVVTLDTNQDFTDTRNISIPPHHQATGLYMLQQGSFEKMTVIECVVAGNGIIRYTRYFPDGSATEVRQRVSIVDVLQANGTPGFTVSPGQQQAYFTGEGRVFGQLGLQTFIDVVIEPLPGYSGQRQQYQIPVTGRSGLDIPVFDALGVRQ